VHSGANYWWGSGVAGNYLSTPNAAANQITGDIEIVSKIDYKNNATLQTIVDKSNGTAFNYSLYIDGSNVPKFIYSVLGVVETAICSSNIGASFNGYIKATRTFVNGVFKFFTSSDGITYTQLGTDISGTIGLLDSNSHPVTIGILQPSSFPFQGKIYRATISNSIGGAPVVDFNPSQYNAATSQTQWTSTTGEVWTINTGTATTGYKGVLVDRTIMQGDGIDDNIFTSTYNRPDTMTTYISYKQNNSSANSVIIGPYPSTQTNNSISLEPGFGEYFYFNNGTAGIDLSPFSINTLIIITAMTNAGIENRLQKNNSIGVSNSYSPTPSESGMSLLSRGTISFSPSNLNTIIISNSANNSTLRTAMYNYIRSINNNAF
jgi:hypothetical protein